MLDEIPNLAGIGHNKPPSEIEILKQRLDGYKIQKDVDRLSARAIPIEIKEDKEAGELSDYIVAVKSAIDNVSDIHAKEKKPFWDAGKSADKWKNDFTDNLSALTKKASIPLLAWNKKKEAEEQERQREIARKAQEAANELARQAEAHAAEGLTETADELLGAAIQEEEKAAMIQSNSNIVEVKSRGSFSSSGIKRPWVGEMDSQAAIDLEALRNYFKPEEINSALNRAVKDGKRDIRGAKIFQDEKLTNRARR